MGTPGRRRSIRRSLAFLGIAAAASMGLTALGAVGAFATITDAIVLGNGDPGESVEGSAISNQIVARFTDTGNPGGANTDCSATRYTATINWGDSNISTGIVTCELAAGGEVASGIFDVQGSNTYADSGNYNIVVSVTDTGGSAPVTKSAQTDTAAVDDLAMTSGGASNITKVEGAKAMVSATFADANQAFSSDDSVDPGLTATIDWGDGSTVTSDLKIAWSDSGDTNVQVTGSHVYDANTPATKAYNVKVTLKDDGVEVQAADSLTATISDAALTADTAKSVVMAGAQASTAVVASFADAAKGQASATDFTTTVKWGDGANSAGTVAQTAAGAFNVSGTHNYATAGTKALTITVTDQEGQTLSMTATVTVPALPTTGQPKTPLPPSLPLLPLIIMALGLIAIAGGVGQTLIRKARR